MSSNSSAAWFDTCEKGGAIPGSDSPALPILTTINSSSNAVTKINAPLPGCGYSVAVHGTLVWVDDGNNVYALNSETDKVLQADPLSNNAPYDISVDGTDAWVVNDQGGTSGNGNVTKIAEASK
jgi:uncharacterized lipoprotein NlpE involved in copper resistance